MNEMSVKRGQIDPRELNLETYYEYCQLYLGERIYEQIPITSPIDYRTVMKVLDCVSDVLLDNLNTETGKIILINKIYSLFRKICDVELSREFLYEQAVHLSKYDPSQYKES